MREDIRRLRVDQVGSLLRPQPLKDAFMACARGELPRPDLDERIDAAIRAAVKRQEAIGFPIVTDGELGRLNFQLSFARVRGWDLETAAWRNFVSNPTMRRAHELPNTKATDTIDALKTPATARLAPEHNVPLAEYRRLAAVARTPAKVMLMGPDRVAQMCDIAGSRPHYADADAFIADVVAVQSQLIGEVIAAGCPYVHLDEPSYTAYVDAEAVARMRQRGEDPRASLARSIRASNGAIAAHHGKAVLGLHICRGNRASMWHREGTYDSIAEELFATLRFDRLLLEYDTQRAGGFEPLRFVPRGPRGPTVVLGLVTTKTGQIESVDSLARRIEEASRFIDLDQLAVSPQCGFASGIAGNAIDEATQWRKLEIVLETARRVWTQ